MMNEELIKRCAREAVTKQFADIYKGNALKRIRQGDDDGCEEVKACVEAVRLMLDRHVAPLVEAAEALLDRYVQAIGNEGIEYLKLRTTLAPFQQEDYDPVQPHNPNFRADSDLPRDGSLVRVWYLDSDDCEASEIVRWDKGRGAWVEALTLDIEPDDGTTILGWEPVSLRPCAALAVAEDQ